MSLFGKNLNDYIQFAKGILILTAVVGILRLSLTLAGAPEGVTWWFSLTGVTLLAIVYFPIRVHRSGFGSYPQVLVLLAMHLLVAGLIITAGISIAVVTGVDNIFSMPEFSGRSATEAPNHLAHAATHLIGGPTISALIVWIPASVVMFVTKLVLKNPVDG